MKGKHSKGNYYADILDDFMVVETLLKYDAPVTVEVLESVFSRFYDVELKLPLPLMPFNDDERRSLALTIIEEMTEALLDIDHTITSFGVEKFEEEIGDPYSLCPDKTERLDNLWREFAGCFAEEINSTVASLELSDNEKEDLYQNFISNVANDLDVSEDDAIEMLQTDKSLRLMLRRNGIDPDKLLPPE